MFMLPLVDSLQYPVQACGRSLIANEEVCDWRRRDYNQCTTELTVEGVDRTSAKNARAMSTGRR